MKTGPVTIFIMERTEAGYSLTSSIDNYENLTFTQSFFNVGSFTFSMLADSPQAKYVNVDSFIIVADNFGGPSLRVGVVQTVDRAIDEGSKKILRAKGLEATCILSYRMVDPGTSAARYTSTGTFEAAVKAMVDSQCGATATDVNRQFPGFAVAASSGRGPTYTFNERWSNLSEAVQKGCIAAEVGYRISWSGSGLVFDTIHGLDRTLGNGINNPAVFSTDFDTVRESHFTLSRSNYKNYAYAGGQGVGTARIIQPVYSTDSTPTGYKRREIFVDARDLSATADLTTRGNQALDEYQYESFVEAVINPFATFAQSSGAALGDLVTVQSFGMEAECRITAITEQWSEAGYDCSFTMDRQLPNVQTIANAEAYKAARANTFAEGTIVDSGDEYLKFSDGTFIQWGNASFSNNSTVSNYFGSTSGTSYYGNYTLTFPIAFYAGTIPNVFPSDSSSSYSASAQSVNNAQATLQIIGGGAGSHVVKWLAIGRWRA